MELSHVSVKVVRLVPATVAQEFGTIPAWKLAPFTTPLGAMAGPLPARATTETLSITGPQPVGGVSALSNSRVVVVSLAVKFQVTSAHPMFPALKPVVSKV